MGGVPVLIIVVDGDDVGCDVPFEFGNDVGSVVDLSCTEAIFFSCFSISCKLL